MKLYIVVPTYNRPKCLLQNIKAIMSISTCFEKLLIIDNESEIPAKDIIDASEFCGDDRVMVHRILENSGASGGFKKGMEIAVELGADYIWAMDDDAYPRPDALENLLKFQRQNDETVLWSNCDKDEDFVSDVKSVTSFMFVGFLISKKIISKVGYPDTKFFMYYDDIEYSIRIRRGGYDILKVRDSIIDHADWSKREPGFNFSFFGLKRELYMGPPYRLYYIVRNKFFITDSMIGRLYLAFKWVLWGFVYLAISLPHSKMSFGGLLHGFFNLKNGKYKKIHD